MKRLVCEMCNSNDLIKQDDCYVCNSCGTRYSTEEAKKLMVDISGSSVTIDNSSFVQKSLENARRAKQKEDWEECEKYYNLVEQNDPKNIEAIFYSSYGKAKMSLVDADKFKREQKMNVLKKSISVIDDNYDPDPEKYEAQKAIIAQIDADLIDLFGSSFVYNTTTETVNGIRTQSDDKDATYRMFDELRKGWIESLFNIVKKIPDNSQKMFYFNLIRERLLVFFRREKKYPMFQRPWLEKIKNLDEQAKAADPNYNPSPSLEELTNTVEERIKKNKKGCLIGLVCIGVLFVVMAIIVLVNM